MPELPVKESRLSELHLPEIKRDDIVRQLSEIRLPTVDLSSLQLPGRDRSAASRFDWRSIDIPGTLAGVSAVGRFGRPLLRRPVLVVAAGTIIVVGLATAALLANPTARERAGRTVRKLRDKAEARMSSSDVLELDIDRDDLPAAGGLVTDEAPLPASEPVTDLPVGDLPAWDESDIPTTDVPDEAARPA